MNRALVALLAGGAAYALTREVVVGLLVAAGVWLFGRRRLLGPTRDGPTATPTWRSQTRRDGGIEVVCKQVTAERQEWVSVRTGRLYDVLAPNGPVDAQPGDHAYVVPTPTGYRIAERAEPRAKSP